MSETHTFSIHVQKNDNGYAWSFDKETWVGAFATQDEAIEAAMNQIKEAYTASVRAFLEQATK
jgi:hypothetical protein